MDRYRDELTELEKAENERVSCRLNRLVGLLESANKLNEIVEGMRSVRWNNNGFRLKDTNEWCEFYVALNKAREANVTGDLRETEQGE